MEAIEISARGMAKEVLTGGGAGGAGLAEIMGQDGVVDSYKV